MKWIYKVLLILFILVICTSAAGSLYFFNRVNSAYNKDNTYVFSEDPQYHFSLVLNSQDDVYWQQFKEGAFEAGKVYNTAIEYNPVTEWDSNGETVEYINIASESKVDGIIVAAENTNEFVNAVNQATQKGINVVVGVVESDDSSRLAYVGTNFYEYGVQAAKLIEEAGEDDDQVNLAVILSSKNNEDVDTVSTTQNDVMLNGLNSALENEHQINLVSTLYRSTDLLGAEDLTRDILTEHPDIDVIFCTNAMDTVAAARVIVERNLVGQVVIVGTDVTKEIINYINKGIVFGVLDRNGYDAGYYSVQALRSSIGSTFQSSYFDINIDAYTIVNISTYK
jgi:ribose transport system substrate-binding protein